MLFLLQYTSHIMLSFALHCERFYTTVFLCLPPFYFSLITWSFLSSLYTGHYRNPLNRYIRHYEGLSYDTELVHTKHQRVKRALSHEEKFLHLEFHAHGRFVSLVHTRVFDGNFVQTLRYCRFRTLLLALFLVCLLYQQSSIRMPQR